MKKQKKVRDERGGWGGVSRMQHTFRPSSWLESVDFPAFGAPRRTTRRTRGFSGMSGRWTKRRSCSSVCGGRKGVRDSAIWIPCQVLSPTRPQRK